MIVFNKDILFIHNPKCAGTTLGYFLLQHLKRPVYNAGRPEIGTYHPSVDLALGYACGIIGQEPADFQKIVSTIRNPYSREVSMYYYFRQILSDSETNSYDINNEIIEYCVNLSKTLELNQYIECLYEMFGTIDIYNIKQYINSYSACNFHIMKVEHVKRDFRPFISSFCSELDFPKQLERHNRSHHLNHTNELSQTSISIINKCYSEIFDIFKYRIL